jgi:hypothetical protein
VRPRSLSTKTRSPRGITVTGFSSSSSTNRPNVTRQSLRSPPSSSGTRTKSASGHLRRYPWETPTSPAHRTAHQPGGRSPDPGRPRLDQQRDSRRPAHQHQHRQSPPRKPHAQTRRPEPGRARDVGFRNGPHQDLTTHTVPLSPRLSRSGRRNTAMGEQPIPKVALRL